ncbi:MAG TPA: RsmB/NOP family class I SAM-dependent RNA methyltransferase [Patescibacteria group bacterium]|nr:RsmB/NOP family class I SAM-dependent RNA methyltransferase [Patescibacteria group bacterium]
MKKSPEQKLAGKRAAWLSRTMLVLSTSEAETRTLLTQERHQSLRLNPLIAKPDETLIQLAAIGWHGKPYEWADNCYTIEEGAVAVRDSAVIATGAAFMQNAASWLPVLALDPQPGEQVLDVCAAPGGKSSHIAALTHNQARLWVNDNSRARLLKMQANLQRLGVTPEDTTLFDATQLARKLAGRQFDKMLLDAPCSGEGLMRYDRSKDFATWSVAHVKRLQQLQKHLITQAWQLLKVGGTLVYSTCTMAPEENEAVVDYLLRTRNDAVVEPFSVALSNRVATVAEWNGKAYSPELQGALRLAPSTDVEAFFVCKLKKVATSDEAML